MIGANQRRRLYSPRNIALGVVAALFVLALIDSWPSGKSDRVRSTQSKWRADISVLPRSCLRRPARA